MSQQENNNSISEMEVQEIKENSEQQDSPQMQLFELGDDLAIKLIKQESLHILTSLELKYHVKIDINEDYGQIQIISTKSKLKNEEQQRNIREARQQISSLALQHQTEVEETYLDCNRDFYNKICKVLQREYQDIPNNYQLEFICGQNSSENNVKEYYPTMIKSYKVFNRYSIKICRLEQPEYLSFDQIDVFQINMTNQGLFLDDFGYQLAKSNIKFHSLIKSLKSNIQLEYRLVDEQSFIQGNKKISLIIQTSDDKQQCCENLLHVLNKLKNQQLSQKGCLRIYIAVRDTVDKQYFETLYSYLYALDSNKNYLQFPSEINFILNERYEKVFTSQLEQIYQNYSNNQGYQDPQNFNQMANLDSESANKMKDQIQIGQQLEPLLYLRGKKDSIQKIKEIISQLQKDHFVKYQLNLQFGQLSEEIKIQIQDICLKQNIHVQITDDKLFIECYKKTLNKYLPMISRLSRQQGNTQIFCQTPPNWEPQNENLKLVELSLNSYEATQCISLMGKTLKSFNVISIQRVQNIKLWRNYQFEKKKLELKGNATEKILFHGTRNNNPSLIYNGTEEGFDFRLSAQGSYGRGIYFHEMASYSDGYVYQKNKSKVFFIANVLVGNFYAGHGSNYVSPPIIPGTNGIRYDSVRSNAIEGNNMFIVYHNSKAYPSYLIKYETNFSKF